MSTNLASAVGLRPLTQADEPLIDRLWQLYVHDLSSSRGSLPNAEGLFRLGHLAWFRDDPGIWKGFLVTYEEAPAGFCYVGVDWDRGRNTIGEFFVVRAVRRRGVGEYVARTLIERYSGSWEIAFQDDNAGAPQFWKRVATSFVGDAWSEEWRPVPDKPYIAPDHWLMFEVS